MTICISQDSPTRSGVAPDSAPTMRSTPPPGSANDGSVGRLRRWNLVAALFHLTQAIVIVVLSTDLALPVGATWATAQPGEPLSGDRLVELFSYRLGWAVAVFSILSAAFHMLVASPWGWPRYVAELGREQNRFRWVEYSLSASLMIVLIAGLVGIVDIAALLALFGVNASMILFGWLMETSSRPQGEVSWTPFVFGCIAGAFPWTAILVYLVGADTVPGFVYGIFVSLFVFFNCFALNQWLQYRRIGPWRSYQFGERAYIVLSFTAKSALAWQIFANVLV